VATKLLAVGEALVDVVRTSGDAPDVEHPGGSPLNIAFGAARLGLESELLTAIGTDARGRAIEAHLASAGVRLAPGSVRDEPTSSATARLRADGSAEYLFDIRWSLPPEAEQIVEQMVESTAEQTAARAGALLVHTGSLGAFVEPGGAQVTRLLAGLAASANPPVVTVDPNMRPSIVGDHAAALARFGELAALATVLKLSDEDAAWLYPGTTVDGAVDRILRLGPALVAVTRGGEGALLATATERIEVPGHEVRVIDTIGAGDSFMSALLVQLAGMLDAGTTVGALRDGSAFDRPALERLGGFATRCAAITVSRAGAHPPTRADLG
jgi:fructokinase